MSAQIESFIQSKMLLVCERKNKLKKIKISTKVENKKLFMRHNRRVPYSKTVLEVKMKEIICKDMEEVAATINSLPGDVMVVVTFEEEGKLGE